MAEDITKIPEEELRKDLEDSYADLLSCEAALKVGITNHHGDIKDRAQKNRYFIKVISEELQRRGNASVVVLPQKDGAK